MVEADRADTSTFLTELFGQVPEDKHGLFWTLQNKGSTWVPAAAGPEAISEIACGLADEGMDVYVAVSVANAPGKTYTRIEASNSAGLMGLWADVDIADPDVHKKWNLPPDEKAAMELLERVGMQPTCVVHSGHGLQAWWLFPEFWEFDSEDERLSAASLAQRFNTTLRVKAAEKGWTVDSVFDLARVMRVPGTYNRKGSQAVPVRLLSSDGPRWNPSDFEEYLVGDEYLAQKGISPTRTYVPDELDLTENAKVPFEKFTALMENSDQFERTWNQSRKDFTDQSPSSYDLSLATQAAMAGWSDQEIAHLIFAWRRHHKHDVSKALRQDYMRRTVARARDAVSRERGAEQLDDVVEQIDHAKATGDPEAEKVARRGGLDAVGEQLGVEVVHFIRYTSEPPTFALVTPTKVVDLGGSDGVLNWFKFRSKVWESLGHQIPRMKPAEWDRITDAIGKTWEDQDVGLEATDSGEVYSWLTQYLAQRPPVPTLDEAAASEYPFVDDKGQTVMFGPAFKRFLWLQHQERISNAKLGQRLRAFGCRPEKVNITIDSTRTSRSVWVLPTERLK